MNKKISLGAGVSVTSNMTKLLALKEELSKKYAARVGVLGQKNHRNNKDSEEKSNADIGLIQELGSNALNIPRRSFLEMPLQLKLPAYYATFGVELMKAIDEGNIRPVYVNLGIKGEQIVQLAFATRGFGMWAENAPLTIKIKGSDSPLIDTGQLGAEITSDVVKK